MRCACRCHHFLFYLAFLEHLAHIEVNQLYFSADGIVEDIAWLDISVANPVLVEVVYSRQQFLCDVSDFELVLGLVLLQVGEGEVLHDQEHFVGTDADIEGFELDDAWVVQVHELFEDLFDLDNLFGLEAADLESIELSGADVPALVDNGT